MGFSLTEATQRRKCKNMEIAVVFSTIRDILIKCCIHINIDKTSQRNFQMLVFIDRGNTKAKKKKKKKKKNVTAKNDHNS